MRKYLLFVSAMFMTMAVSAQNKPITEQPEGELRYYHGYSVATDVEWGYADDADHDGVMRQVVFADNGVDVYFKDPLTKSPKGTWIKGTLKDGIITVETPQVIYQTTKDDGSVLDWYVQRLVGTEVYDEEWDLYDTEYSIDTEKTAMTYIYRNDSIIQEDKDIKLGLMCEGKHYYYGDANVIYSRVDEKANNMPAGVEPEIWSIKCLGMEGHDYRQIKVAIVDNEVYIKGIWKEQPDACFKGFIDGDKVYIPSKQYVGWLNSPSLGNSYYMYYMNAVEDYNMIYRPGYLSTDEAFELAYDKEAKTLVQSSPEKFYGTIKYGKSPNAYDLSPVAKFTDVRMAYTDVNNLAAPVTPYINSIRYEEDYGWGSVSFDIYPEDLNGNCYDIDHFYYTLFLDEDVLVIDPDDTLDETKYEGIDEPIIEVPYTFINEHGIDKDGSMTTRQVMYYRTGFKEIGVMAVYHNPVTGEKQYSDICYYNRLTGERRTASPTGINNVQTGNADVESVSYYDTCGRKVDASYKGIVIKTVRYANGAKETTKVVNR